MIISYKKKIIKFYYDHKRMPSYSEIMHLVGFKSKNAVFKLVKKLVEDGFLLKDKSGRLLPSKLYGDVRVLGTVEAGFPSPAEEELSDTMTMDEYLIENREATFMLKVSGDSMKDAGIMPGDLVLVERGREPAEGDIVIAEVDKNWTMKYFRKKSGMIYLQAANEKYKDIVPTEELKIAAIVKAVVRKY
ncbi:transcriptional repressor LexA [Patescibacteria group bacterium]|nr:transcriptional repressor LexA [Patescibacteria group bacterium]MBU1613121.1 transcriptional repressor LexA [Patescibacteria group bacterium]